MSNFIKFVIFGVTSIILYKKINNKIKNKNVTNSATQTDLSYIEIEQLSKYKHDLESINNGTYTWYYFL